MYIGISFTFYIKHYSLKPGRECTFKLSLKYDDNYSVMDDQYVWLLIIATIGDDILLKPN